MDIHKAKELSKFAHLLRDNAIKYAKYRVAAGTAKADLDILLAAELTDFRKQKKNLGYEMATLMLAENNQVAKDLIKTVTVNTARYKSLERVIDSLQATISMEQSIMKYEKENT